MRAPPFCAVVRPWDQAAGIFTDYPQNLSRLVSGTNAAGPGVLPSGHLPGRELNTNLPFVHGKYSVLLKDESKVVKLQIAYGRQGRTSVQSA